MSDAEKPKTPAQEIVLAPGQVVQLTTEGARREQSAIFAMGLGNGKILFTGGAELVEAIDGSDWDWKSMKDSQFSHTVYDPPEGADEVLKNLVRAASEEIQRFYENQMMKPNMVVVSLDFRHLGIRSLGGCRVAFGYQPINEVRCAYVPHDGSV